MHPKSKCLELCQSDAQRLIYWEALDLFSAKCNKTRLKLHSSQFRFCVGLIATSRRGSSADNEHRTNVQ